MLIGITPDSKSRILKTKNAKTRLINVSLAPQFPKPQKKRNKKNKTKNTKQGNTCTSISSLLRCDVLSGGEYNLLFCFYLEEDVSLIYMMSNCHRVQKEICTSFSHWIENTPQVKKVKLTVFILSLLKWVIPEEQRGVLV